MWRREERLTYWLENTGQTQKTNAASEFIGRLSLKLRPANFGGGVQEEIVDIAANAHSLDDSLVTKAYVRDGLGGLGSVACCHSEAKEASGPQDDCSIRQIHLVRNARFFDVPLSNEGRACIRQLDPVFAPVCRHLLLNVAESEVINLITPHSHPPLIIDGGRFLIPPPSVNQYATKILEFTLSRMSIDIEGLTDAERTGFLHEAEVLKGIPSDQAKLLAVFRHVPIELISRLCFLEEKKAILYSIAREAQLTKTRVHDMAAVRDQQSREIHLIPHRMRFRSVSLK